MVLSFNNMRRFTQHQLNDAGNTTTLAHYLNLLSAAFLVSGLPLFAKGKIRRRGSSPKLIQLCEIGVEFMETALIKAFALVTHDGGYACANDRASAPYKPFCICLLRSCRTF